MSFVQVEVPITYASYKILIVIYLWICQKVFRILITTEIQGCQSSKVQRICTFMCVLLAFFFPSKSKYIPVDTESQPWSNNSPSGVLVPVLLACLPSIASNDWYKNRPTAHSKYTILGAYSTKSILNKIWYQYKLF